MIRGLTQRCVKINILQFNKNYSAHCYLIAKHLCRSEKSVSDYSCVDTDDTYFLQMLFNYNAAALGKNAFNCIKPNKGTHDVAVSFIRLCLF